MAAIQCGCGHIYYAGGFHAKYMGLDTRDYCYRCEAKDELIKILRKYMKGKKAEECYSDIFCSMEISKR